MKMRTGHRGWDSETVTGSSRPNAATRPRDSSFLELQRLVGNAAVTELVSRSATGDQARQGRRALDSRLRAASAAVASGGGPTASAQVNGRRLFSDGSGATSTEDKGATTQVGAISGGALVKAPRGPTTTTRVTNSTETQLTTIWEAVARARQMLDQGIAALQGADSLPEKAMSALEANFHNVDRSGYPTRVKLLYEIRESLAKVRHAFDGEIPIEVEDKDDDNTLGYVRDYWLFKGDIHLHPLWFRSGAGTQAATVVHEACHKYDNDDDHAYWWQSKYDELSAAEAADNADSYAHFCSQVE